MTSSASVFAILVSVRSLYIYQRSDPSLPPAYDLPQTYFTSVRLSSLIRGDKTIPAQEPFRDFPFQYRDRLVRRFHVFASVGSTSITVDISLPRWLQSRSTSFRLFPLSLLRLHLQNILWAMQSFRLAMLTLDDANHASNLDAIMQRRGQEDLEANSWLKATICLLQSTTDLANADSAGRVACEYRPGEEGKDQACNGRHDEDKAKSNGSARIPMSMTTSFDGKKEQKALYQIDEQIWRRPKGLVSDDEYREDFQCSRRRFLTQTT